ncbi:MAG: DNA primase [Bacteroidota bacterium]
MAIPPATIQRIRDTADIVDVVGDFVQLKKRGKDMIANCPFHDEKTPSFHVNPTQGYFKCFGCGKGGDSITFIMEIEKLTYPEALRWLAAKYSITIAEEQTGPKTDEETAEYRERESLYIVMNWAKNFYREHLQSAEGRALGLSYFRERQLSDKTIETFELGFSPEAWDSLIIQAKKEGHTEALLEKAGLLTRREDGRTYDRFRNRAMFPIHNVSGKTIAFGARMLGTDKNQPKYLNSPETPLYHKSEVLYGIFQAKQSIRTEDNCYLCEGYTDVISMHQAGVKNAVASSGTSLTEEQIKQIGRFTKNITVLYDGDKAGIKAGLRGIDMILEAGLNVRAVSFPDGHDPDSYLNAVGTIAFATFLKEKAQNFINFKASLFAEEAAADPYRKAEVIRDLVGSISKIPEPLTRLVFLRQCAELLKVPEGILIAEANKALIKQQQKPKQRPVPSETAQPDMGPRSADDWMADMELAGMEEAAALEREFADSSPEIRGAESLIIQERACLKILINFASVPVTGDLLIADYYIAELQDLVFSSPVLQKMMDALRAAMAQGGAAGPDLFLNHEDPEVRSEAVNLLFEKYSISENWAIKHDIHIQSEEARVKDASYTNMLGIKQRFLRKRSLENLEALRHADEEAVSDFIILQMQLKDAEKQIANLLGNTYY